ncbi:MAG TPA: YceI family protein [Longimicrobiales bacterium]|nr:YceI family protein [Longimicrobiales bacterium]
MRLNAGVRLGIVAVMGLSVTAAGRVDPVRFDIDQSHSYVGFTVRHLGVSNVKGKFTRFSGHIMLNETDVTQSTVNVTVETGSIDTSNERRDNHLRSEDFFEAERFPQLTFVSSRIEETADGLVLVGNLTIRDVTKEVRVPFELSGPVTTESGRQRLGAEGTLRIDRFDYGLQWNRIQEAVQVVGDEVRIELNIEANTPRQG